MLWRRKCLYSDEIVQNLEILRGYDESSLIFQHPILHRVQLKLSMVNWCVPIGILHISSALLRTQARCQFKQLKGSADAIVSTRIDLAGPFN